ncbi:MAG: acetyl-CoA carboxylase biotin carboxyl carrier protein subunit [Gemmatimonadaceae bacterium]|nr:acetyl-CoA carboxylase biotin carboxyl carrier protein subunit [Gemmatimonadaceae bacterium]MCW5825313.1 acetyl-CoA carboxylase biotin carboxyl carrier protein subunit [Gemmatimonadaceae bacterium]
MKYIVEIDGERHEVDLADGQATYAGSAAAAALLEVQGSPVHVVNVGGKQYQAVVKREVPKGRYVLWIDGWRFELDALDERARAIRDLSAAAAGAQGPAPVVAPMPGLIVRLHVQVGDQVEAGQPVVVMEAMKMENELRAQAAGRVKAIHAQSGKAVEKGMVLVELDG